MDILKSLILKGQNRTFDGIASEYKLDDVSFTLLDATVSASLFPELKNDARLPAIAKIMTKERINIVIRLRIRVAKVQKIIDTTKKSALR